MEDGIDADAAVPVDKGHVAYWIMWLQGAGMLFPWNVFINASGYYAVRFQGTPFAHDFENAFSVAFNFTTVTGLIISVRYQHLLPQKYRVILPLCLMVVAQILSTALVLVTPEQIDGDTLFAVTILCVMISGWSVAMLSGGIFGLSGKFPAMYTQAVMGGQGFAGVSVSLSAIFTTAASSVDQHQATYDSVRTSAFLYFLISTLVILFCLITYMYLERLPFAQYHIDPTSPKFGRTRTPIFRAMDARDPSTVMDGGAFKRANSTPNYGQTPVRGNIESERESLVHSPEGLGAYETPRGAIGARDSMGDRTTGQKGVIASVFGQVRPLAFAVGYVFFITLALFPSVTAVIRSVKNPDNIANPPAGRFYGDLFVPFGFLCFNVGDFAGRTMAGYSQIVSATRLWLPIALRTVFFPLFLMCNVQGLASGENASYFGHNTFDNDAWPILFMLFFSFSNGYLSSLCMMYGPSLVNESERETAGTVMILFLQMGLFTGALFSFALKAFICSCNPFNA